MGSAQERLTGRIAVVGSAPATFVVLQPEGSRAVRLEGELESELRRLSGIVVRAEGTMTDRNPGAAFAVRKYEIVSVDGQVPETGELLVRSGALWLAGRDTVRLAGPVPDELKARPGAKVWIVGPRDEEGLRVQQYGVVREPGRL